MTLSSQDLSVLTLLASGTDQGKEDLVPLLSSDDARDVAQYLIDPAGRIYSQETIEIGHAFRNQLRLETSNYPDLSVSGSDLGSSAFESPYEPPIDSAGGSS